MSEYARFPREAWPPLLAGLLWLWQAQGHGLLGFLVAVLPGCLMLGSGVCLLLTPGDRRLVQLAALGGVSGIALVLPAWIALGFGSALLLGLAAAASALAAGAHSVRREPNTEEVPEPIPGPGLSAQVALDEALILTTRFSIPFPRREGFARIRAELGAAEELFETRGWLEKPADYHREPPPPDAPSLVNASSRGIPYEHMSFESGYAPDPEEPGRDRWLDHVSNRRAHAWVLRHRGAERPWLVGIHGYQMGMPLIDLLAFDPAWLHHRLGMNLLLPVLPLHGPRKVHLRSGDGFLTGDVLDTVHAAAQAQWDIRRMLHWVREQSDAPIGVMGFSLGGYNAALLAGLDAQLACALAGIPVTDVARLFYRHGPAVEIGHAEQAAIEEAQMRRVLRVVSPLAIPPRVPKEYRYLFGGVADRLTPPDQVRDLWRFWERPRIEWYQGSHVTFRVHAGVRRLIREALRESGLTL